MTCPLNRCDGSGWIAEADWPLDESGPRVRHEPCSCHGWRPIEEATDYDRDGCHVLSAGRMREAYWDSYLGEPSDEPPGWYSVHTCRRLDPQPTHYFPRPLAPELTTTETTERRDDQ